MWWISPRLSRIYINMCLTEMWAQHAAHGVLLREERVRASFSTQNTSCSPGEQQEGRQGHLRGFSGNLCSKLHNRDLLGTWDILKVLWVESQNVKRWRIQKSPLPFTGLVSQQPVRGRQMFGPAHSWMGSAVGLVLKLEAIRCRMRGRLTTSTETGIHTPPQLKICRNFRTRILSIKKRLLP